MKTINDLENFDKPREKMFRIEDLGFSSQSSNLNPIHQREKLQRQIWQIANDVRVSVDGWDFKQYVLGTLS